MDRTRVALDKAREKRLGGRPIFSVSPLPTANANPVPIKYQQTKVLALSPKTLRANNVISGLENEPFADVYRILRTHVLRRLSAEGLSTLAICSANKGEGKTLTAVNLAISLAMDVNQTVLLVDLDLRSPSVAETLGIQPEFGLDDFLHDSADLPQCLINPGTERLVILPVRAPMEQSSEMLASPKVAKLAHELKNRYPDRVVLYDLPPLLATDDCLAFMSNVDATLCVVAEGETPRPDIERAMMLLGDSHLIGTVLNKSTQKQFNAYR
jgi:capsular exopolysaccharide synthesis family protein